MATDSDIWRALNTLSEAAYQMEDRSGQKHYCIALIHMLQFVTLGSSDYEVEKMKADLDSTFDEYQKESSYLWK